MSQKRVKYQRKEINETKNQLFQKTSVKLINSNQTNQEKNSKVTRHQHHRVFSADSTNIKRIGEYEQLYANKFYNTDENAKFLQKHKESSFKIDYII